MLSFLLIISFLLHLITLGALYQLYKRYQVSKGEKSSKDMMELFELYLTEVRDENKRLEKILLKREPNKSVDVIKSNHSFNNDVQHKKEIDNTYRPQEVNTDVNVETSLQAKILQMHDLDQSNEEIARKLNCGKTEVDLIIKLHAKK